MHDGRDLRQPMETPFFSVIIPVYNRVDSIAAAIDSVLAQTVKDFEIIVVDDGSTDATPHRLTDYGESIRVFRQANAGGGPARQLGLSKARGTYVAFLDSDDTWPPWTLATYRRAIDETHGPALILGKARHTNREPRDTDHADFHCSVHADFFASTGNHRWYGFSVIAARRSVIPQHGSLPLTRAAAQDIHFLLSMGTAAGFVAIQSPMTAVYSVHAGNISGSPDELLKAMRYLLAKENQGAFPGGMERRRSRRDLICRSIRAASMKALRSGNHRAALRLYASSFRWHLSNGRLNYLLGFPVVVLGTVISQAVRRSRPAPLRPASPNSG